MDLALAEARKGMGMTAPNPAVGAVVVKEGKVIGKGYHRKAGGPHAEIHALREAGAEAKNATIVVTLEPCSTTGTTGACTTAILNAGIRNVIVGCTDPNPAHAGRGLDLLRDAGVAVTEGVREAECREVVRAFSKVQRAGRPYVSLKMACTLDGRIADASGKSRWITGSASRERVQKLRRECDAVLVGTETVRVDDPSLMPRPRKGRNPLRIIPDRRGVLRYDRKVFTDAHADRTLCLLGPDANDARRKRLERLGVACMDVPVRRETIDWTRTLNRLASRGVQHILCEGGGQLAGALLKAGLVDELHWVIAPKLLGATARPAVAGGWKLPGAPGFRTHAVEQLGGDVWLTLRPF